MARRVAWLCLLALACAAPPLAPSPDAPPAAPPTRSAIEDALGGLELSFLDPDTLELHRTVGPYRIVGREPGQLRIEGVDALAHAPRIVTLLENGDEIWAWTRIGSREFLARIR